MRLLHWLLDSHLVVLIVRISNLTPFLTRIIWLPGTVIRGMYKRNSFVKFTLMKKEWLRSLISIRKCTFIMPIPKTPSYADILRSRYYTFSLRSASSKEPPPSLALPGSNPTASSAALRVAVLLFVLPDPPKPNDIGLSSLH